MSKRWRNAGLYALLAVVLVAIITAFIPQRGQSNAPQPLHYSEFIDQVEANQVAKVAIASDQRSAQMVHTDNRRSLVNLAPDHNLLPLLSQHQVDIAVLPDSGPRLAGCPPQPGVPPAAVGWSVFLAASDAVRWRQSGHELWQESGTGPDGTQDSGHLW